MSRYHIHLIYAVSFATTDAMQYASSDTNVHMNYSANYKQKVNLKYNMLKPNPEACHQDTMKKGEVQTQKVEK